jgi:integrase
MNTVDGNFKVQYIPAKICDNKELTIKYYAYHPVECRMKRVVMRFNHLKDKMTKTELNRHLRNIMHDINVNLAAGKNPFIAQESPKSYCKLNEAIDMFLKLKARDMRPDGLRSYTSYSKKLKEWAMVNGLEDCFVISFTREKAIDMMNELAMNDELSNRTWNNHFVFYRSLWNWFIKNMYCSKNVFMEFDKKREAEKIRKSVPKETHARVAEYCKANMPNMEIVIDLVRASFIRPKEISMIQIKEIDLFNKVITIPSEKSKTHSTRFAYLPEWLCEKIVDNIALDRYPGDYYLIGSGLNPSKNCINTRTIDKYWCKIRNDLDLGMEMQLYSYRDTGITALEEKGVPRNVIQKLTDHKTERMVGKYVGKPNKELIDNIVSKIDEFL